MSPDLTCPASYGLRHCCKPLYLAKCGDVWPHPGGHFFVTDEQQAKLDSGSAGHRGPASEGS